MFFKPSSIYQAFKFVEKNIKKVVVAPPGSRSTCRLKHCSHTGSLPVQLSVVLVSDSFNIQSPKWNSEVHTSKYSIWGLSRIHLCFLWPIIINYIQWRELRWSEFAYLELPQVLFGKYFSSIWQLMECLRGRLCSGKSFIKNFITSLSLW